MKIFGRNKKLSDEQKKNIEIIERIRHELVDVYKLILNPDHWCQRALCRDAQGEQLFYPSDVNATQWCLLGAVYKSENDNNYETLTFLQKFAKLSGIDSLVQLNDQEGHEAVLEFLEEVLRSLGVKLTLYNSKGKVIRRNG